LSVDYATYFVILSAALLGMICGRTAGHHVLMYSERSNTWMQWRLAGLQARAFWMRWKLI